MALRKWYQQRPQIASIWKWIRENEVKKLCISMYSVDLCTLHASSLPTSYLLCASLQSRKTWPPVDGKHMYQLGSSSCAKLFRYIQSGGQNLRPRLRPRERHVLSSWKIENRDLDVDRSRLRRVVLPDAWRDSDDLHEDLGLVRPRCTLFPRQCQRQGAMSA